MLSCLISSNLKYITVSVQNQLLHQIGTRFEISLAFCSLLRYTFISACLLASTARTASLVFLSPTMRHFLKLPRRKIVYNRHIRYIRHNDTNDQCFPSSPERTASMNYVSHLSLSQMSQTSRSCSHRHSSTLQISANCTRHLSQCPKRPGAFCFPFPPRLLRSPANPNVLFQHQIHPQYSVRVSYVLPG